MRDFLRRLFYIKNVLLLILIKKGVKIRFSTEVKHPELVQAPSKIGKNSFLSGCLGRYSYIGDNCSLNANIGCFCSIADNVRTVEGKHPLNFVSTSPVFYSQEGHVGEYFANNNLYNEIALFDTNPPVACIIEDDVWIGEGVLIKGGITIGRGSCVGMGAVVVKDVPPYTVVGGNPAHVIKKRFTDEEIKQLERIKWWESPKQWLSDNWFYFQDLPEFISRFNKSL